jgi:hypothetical protein
MLHTGCQAYTLGIVNSFILFRGCVWAACLALQTNCQANILAKNPHFSQTGIREKGRHFLFVDFSKRPNEWKFPDFWDFVPNSGLGEHCN